MDTLPLDHNPPKSPRNLTLSLAIWLRRMGFTVLEQGGIAPTALEATWRSNDGWLYQVSYAYAPQGSGIFQLLAYQSHLSPAADYRGLVHKAEVNRIREARFLLLSNVFYAEARKAALTTGTLKPTYAQHTD
jgi:hypothetical protein